MFRYSTQQHERSNLVLALKPGSLQPASLLGTIKLEDVEHLWKAVATLAKQGTFDRVAASHVGIVSLESLVEGKIRGQKTNMYVYSIESAKEFDHPMPVAIVEI